MGARRRRVVWTATALDELGEGTAHVAQYAPRAAARLVRQILDAAASLDTLSERGGAVRQYRPEGAPHDIRCSGSGWWGVLDIPTNPPPPGSDSRDAASTIWVADDSGRVVRELGSVAFGQNRPLRPLTSVAAGRDVFHVGTADSAWVDAYAPSGERLEGVRLGVTGRDPSA